MKQATKEWLAAALCLLGVLTAAGAILFYTLHGLLSYTKAAKKDEIIHPANKTNATDSL